MATAEAANAQAGTVRYCDVCAAVFRTDFDRCPSDGGALALSPTDPLLGTTIAEKYVIEDLIGEGAMGRVYRAHHRQFPTKRYAIKVLIGDLAASSIMRKRFEREAQNASRLDHPNVVNVIDYGHSVAGLHFLVMDLVEGTPLGAIVQRGPMAADRVIRIAHQLCEGLEHAHSRGVIHRDFKSDNILIVGEPGREVARIADFGLAMSTTQQADPRLTTNGVACTPAYAAPEQLRGRKIDGRCDLYALGATMFEMLSGGYLPFEGDIEVTVAAKLNRDAPSILTRAPNVPPGLVTLVTRLLEQEPEDRPQSARAVIRALETAMTLRQPAIRILDMRPESARATRARRKRVALGAVLVAIALGAGYMSDAPSPLPDVAVDPEPELLAVEAQLAVHEQAPAGRAAEPEAEPEPEPAPVQRMARVAPRTMAARTRAAAIADKYGVIGRQLVALENARGKGSTLDLWAQYRRIELTEAMATPAARSWASAVLARIERAIAARR